MHIYMVRLDGPLISLTWLKMSQLTAGRLDWLTFKDPSQPKLYYDSTYGYVYIYMNVFVSSFETL